MSLKKQTEKENAKPAADAQANETPSAEPNKADGEKPTEGKAPGEGEENDEEAPEEETAQDQEPSKEKPIDEAAKPATEGEETPTDEQPAAPPPPAANEDAEKTQLASDLLAARSQLAAYAAGVAPEMIADAVTLATAEAGPEADEAAVTKAMQAVLKRHPEWKAAESMKKTGGFKLGADPDKASEKKQGGAAQNTKRWNRFK